MKNYSGIFICVFVLTLALQSCKKEEDNSTHVPAPPHAPSSPIVNSVPLNGGNISGRWTFVYDQTIQYENDTMTYYDTASYPPGFVIVNFMTNDTLELIDGDTTYYPYWVSGNNLSIIDSPDTLLYTYGVATNRLRWHKEESYQLGNTFYEYIDDLIFDRY